MIYRPKDNIHEVHDRLLLALADFTNALHRCLDELARDEPAARETPHTTAQSTEVPPWNG